MTVGQHDYQCSHFVFWMNVGGKSIAIEKVKNSEEQFEKLKVRLHHAKGGPTRAKMWANEYKQHLQETNEKREVGISNEC